MALEIIPITHKQAKEYIAKHHRHNEPPLMAVFVVGVQVSDELVGVAMAGLPKARLLMDGRTLEVNRTCTDGHRNANSMLYGACARAAKALGYKRLITYTLHEESGASLKAAGWNLVDDRAGGTSWAHHTINPGYDPQSYQDDLFKHKKKMPLGRKNRWERLL